MEGLLGFPLAGVPKLQKPSVVVVEKVVSTKQVIVVNCVDMEFDECHPYEGIGEYDDLLDKFCKDTCFSVSPDCLLVDYSF